MNQFALQLIPEIQMKEAIDKDQIPEKQPEFCLQCQFMLAHPNLESMCAVCYQKKKKQHANTEVKLQQGHKQDKYEENTTLSDFIVKQQQSDQDDFTSEEYTDEEYTELQSPKIKGLPGFMKISNRNRDYDYDEFVLQHLDVKLEEGAEEASEDIRISAKRGYPEIFEVKKDKCNFCNKKTGLLGHQCGYCKINFCNSHRLPQNHECTADYLSKCRKRLRKELLQGSIDKKHKGKIAEI